MKLVWTIYVGNVKINKFLEIIHENKFQKIRQLSDKLTFQKWHNREVHSYPSVSVLYVTWIANTVIIQKRTSEDQGSPLVDK